MTDVIVLMYHAVEDTNHPSGARGLGEQMYVLQSEQFRKQIEHLHRSGYRTFLFEELTAMDVWPEKAVVLTFDDGHESNYTLALPILKEFGFRAHFFVTTGWIGAPHFLTQSEIKALHKEGMGIGSHGDSHRYFTEISASELQKELDTSHTILSDIVGQPVLSFSAPGGRINARVIDIARASGYSLIFTSQPSCVSSNKRSCIVPRFAMRHDDHPEAFSALINQDPHALRMIYRRTTMLNVIKKVLGDRRYEKVRQVLLGGV